MPDEYEMLAGATLCEAIYVAAGLDNENVYVQSLKEEGLTNVLILKANTPDDVQSWVKQEHNQYHHGGGTNFLELYEKVSDVETAWECERKRKGITRAGCPAKGPHTYAKVYEQFLMDKFGNYYSNWDHYDNIKSFMHDMSNHGLYADYKRFVETKVDFLSGVANASQVARINNQIIKLLILPFQDVDIALIKICITEALRFVIPVEAGFEESMLYFCILAKHSDTNAIIKRFGLMKTPMGESKIYVTTDKGNKRKIQEVEDDDDDGDEPKAKSKAKAKGKGRAKAKAQAVGSMLTEEVMDKMTGEREKLFLDDLLSAITAPLSQLPREHWVWSAVSRCIRLGLWFMLDETITLNGKMVDKWSRLRTLLTKEIVMAHSATLSRATGIQVDDNATSDDVATQILNLIGGAPAAPILKTDKVDT